MLCPRCSYIRFKASPKCLTCGFPFKNGKSNGNALGESDNGFTIFSANGQDVTAAKVETSALDFAEPSSHEGVDEEMSDPAGYDPALELLGAHFRDSGDFELDLSEMDNPDAEHEVMGATLIESFSETSGMAPKVSSKISEQSPKEIEYQGLGFKTTEELDNMETGVAQQEKSTTFLTEPGVLDEEGAIPEMEPYAMINEIELEPLEIEAPQIRDESIPKPPADVGEKVQEAGLELPDLSLNDSSPGQGDEMEDGESGEIALETELELDEKFAPSELGLGFADISENPKISIDLEDDPIDLEPTPESGNLHPDLGTESLEIEDLQENPLQVPDLQSSRGNGNHLHSPQKNSNPGH